MQIKCFTMLKTGGGGRVGDGITVSCNAHIHIPTLKRGGAHHLAGSSTCKLATSLRMSALPSSNKSSCNYKTKSERNAKNTTQTILTLSSVRPPGYLFLHSASRLYLRAVRV